MAALLQTDREKKSVIYSVPEHRYVRWGTAASITAHLLVALVVFILAWLNHIKNLRDLMSPATAVPPPPQNEIEVVFPPDDTPPPPTDHPLFINQIVKVPPPPIIPPKVKPKPVPKPVVHKATKAPPVVSHTQTQSAPSSFHVGSGPLSQPQYPSEAAMKRIQGTLFIRVIFDANGDVTSFDVVKSSGSSILDDATRSWAMRHWQGITQLAGQTGECPVTYQLQ